MIERRAGRQRVAASRTVRRKMIDDRVGLGRLPESLALVAFLPAGLLAGGLAQARHPRRLLQAVARRRLAAVGTVQAEPALKLRDPRLQSRVIRQQRLD